MHNLKHPMAQEYFQHLQDFYRSFIVAVRVGSQILWNPLLRQVPELVYFAEWVFSVLCLTDWTPKDHPVH